MDEHTLVRAMLAGDETAFEDFFDGQFPRLYRFALARLRDPDAAQDIVQATLVTAVGNLATWRGESALFTWLCALCRHELSAYYRRLGRQPEVQAMDEDPDIRRRLEALADGRAERPDVSLERGELVELVQLTLDYLPGRYGDILEWKYLHGLAVKEIAERLRATPNAAESLLTRARQAFRAGFTDLARARGSRAAPEES